MERARTSGLRGKVVSQRQGRTRPSKEVVRSLASLTLVFWVRNGRISLQACYGAHPWTPVPTCIDGGPRTPALPKRLELRQKVKKGRKIIREVARRILFQVAWSLRFVLAPATSDEITGVAVNRGIASSRLAWEPALFVQTVADDSTAYTLRTGAG